MSNDMSAATHAGPVASACRARQDQRRPDADRWSLETLGVYFESGPVDRAAPAGAKNRHQEVLNQRRRLTAGGRGFRSLAKRGA